MFSAVRHFSFVLEGRHFRILTDQLPLTLAMRRVSPLWSGRQVRQLAYDSEFSTDIRHTPGLRNMVADGLSQPPLSPQPQPSHTPPVKPSVVGSLVVAKCVTASRSLSHHSLCREYSCSATSPPASSGCWFRPPSGTLHSVAQGGSNCHAGQQQVFWTGMRRYVQLYAQNCLSCKRSKVSRHVHLAPATIAVPRCRFEHIHAVFRFFVLVYCGRQNYPLAGSDSSQQHHRRRLRSGPLHRLDTAVRRPCSHHLRQGRAILFPACGRRCVPSSPSTTSAQPPTTRK